MHGGGGGSLADRGRGAVLAAPALCWFPAHGSSHRHVQGGLSAAEALLEESPLPDTASGCRLPLWRRASLRAGLVEGTAATGQATGMLRQQKSKGALTSTPTCHTAVCPSYLLFAGALVWPHNED